MRLDRDSKQPIWLGLVLIFAAFIFTLFFITRVQASDLSDYDYNNVLLVQFSGATIEFCFADGSFGFRRNIGYEYTDGVPVITQDELENNLDGVFAYLLPSETIVLLFDNYAAAGPYLDTKSYFAQRGCAVLDYSGSFPLDVSGFSLSKINAGTWFIPYYSRSVPLTSTPTPTPTSAPEEYDIYSFYMKAGSYGNFMLFDVKVHRSNNVQAPNSNSAVNYVRNLYERYDDLFFTQNVLILRQGFYSGSSPSGFPTMQLYVPISDLNFEIDIYNAGSDYIGSFDYIRENFTKTSYNSPVIASNNSVYINTLTADNGYVICVGYLLGNYNGFVQFGSDYAFYKGDGIEQYYYYESSTNHSSVGFSFSSSSDNSINASSWRWAIEYMTGITAMPTPSPDPNAPSPTPSPTEPPHVIINWPSGTPTPTPPFSVPAEDSGGGSGSPGGSSQGSLTPGQVNTTLNTFKQYTQNNGAFAFLYACTGLIPDVALYFLFILLFILLLLACLRLFVHFTGG